MNELIIGAWIWLDETISNNNGVISNTTMDSNLTSKYGEKMNSYYLVSKTEVNTKKHSNSGIFQSIYTLHYGP